MKYALIFAETQDEIAKRSSQDAPTYWGAWGAYIELLATEGALVPGAGAGLAVPETATTVRSSENGLTIQDGPLAAVKEQLGGFVVIDVPNLDTALRLAQQAPCAQPGAGAVEIRPLMPDPES